MHRYPQFLHSNAVARNLFSHLASSTFMIRVVSNSMNCTAKIDVKVIRRVIRLYDRAPREQLVYNDGHLCPEEDACDAARFALKIWNEKSILNKGVSYELIEVAGAKRMAIPYVLHCNFIARPCTGSKAEDKLFFAEMTNTPDFLKNAEGGDLGCSECCIVGPSGTKTGLVGCVVCGIGPGLVHHPENGAFIKSRTDCFQKDIARRDLAIKNRRGCPPETEADKCALVALSSWNTKSLAQQGPEYELDRTLGCNKITAPTIYHCNFTARPVDGSVTKNVLFFAELKYSKEFSNDGEDAALGCLLCCILGSRGYAKPTKNLGCRICDSDSRPTDRIEHPEYEDFIKGRRDAMYKSTAKKK